ncbi:hypothetical protein B0H66DRAFT_139791 [Apodospora peruviana]|uniref:Uncharacterized protein n=1 Tax=Apodospora peruviana TaxID=516989 RepID=A0AAE0IIQ2_9PEZI|nr:hypothetical protein B0H66DRAFT_139791 [Apodospora peruviana]
MGCVLANRTGHRAGVLSKEMGRSEGVRRDPREATWHAAPPKRGPASATGTCQKPVFPVTQCTYLLPLRPRDIRFHSPMPLGLNGGDWMMTINPVEPAHFEPVSFRHLRFPPSPSSPLKYIGTYLSANVRCTYRDCRSHRPSLTDQKQRFLFALCRSVSAPSSLPVAPEVWDSVIPEQHGCWMRRYSRLSKLIALFSLVITGSDETTLCNRRL